MAMINEYTLVFCGQVSRLNHASGCWCLFVAGGDTVSSCASGRNKTPFALTLQPLAVVTTTKLFFPFDRKGRQKV